MTKDIQFCGSIDEAPSLPGAYMIAIELAKTIVVTLGGRAAIDLPAGRYPYCGSAKGPSGLKARSFAPLPSRQVGAMACRPADRARQCGRQLDFPRRARTKA